MLNSSFADMLPHHRFKQQSVLLIILTYNFSNELRVLPDDDR
jgi:hypothetical protein